jgi:hypothetical protein
MHNKRLLVLAAAGLLCGSAVVGLWTRPTPNLAPPRVTLRYIYQTDSRGRPDDGPTFWVTNHTAKTLSLCLNSIEIQTNRAWTIYSKMPDFGVLFFTSNKKREGVLAPHAAGYGSMSMLSERVFLPTNRVWRVKASVAEKLVGADNVVAAVRVEPRMLRLRHLTGETNIPMNPFAPNVMRFGNGSDVFSEEVQPR